MIALSATYPSIDLVDTGTGLALDDGLTTAVLCSLFTDRRAAPDDLRPGDAPERRGWALDLFNPDDRWGSKLWLLAREKATGETLARARAYAEEALAWLIEDGLAARVEVLAEAQGERLALHITVDGRATATAYLTLGA